jgi:hypothetical protein
LQFFFFLFWRGNKSKDYNGKKKKRKKTKAETVQMLGHKQIIVKALARKRKHNRFDTEMAKYGTAYLTRIGDQLL